MNLLDLVYHDHHLIILVFVLILLTIQSAVILCKGLLLSMRKRLRRSFLSSPIKQVLLTKFQPGYWRSPSLLPVIVSIINNSLRIGSFPSVLREAVITPLIKKPTLNPDLLKNYRSVSNLPAFGKILEYPAFSRFKQHFQINGLSETFQSAYRINHATVLRPP